MTRDEHLRCDIVLRRPDGSELDAGWHVRRLDLVEAIHDPFSMRLLVESDDAGLDPLELVGGRLTIDLTHGETQRRLHAVVLRSEVVGTMDRRLQLALEAGPAAAIAGIGSRSRIFQHKTVPAIAHEVLGAAIERYSASIEQRLAVEHPVRDYVVQWRESDLEFALRILADAGITCLFEHDGDGERVVFVDDVAQLRGVESEGAQGEGPTSVRFVGDRGALAAHESVAVLGPASRLAATRHDVVGWDWKQIPPTRLEGSDGPTDDAHVEEDVCRRRLVEIARHAHLDDVGLRAGRHGTSTRTDARRCAGWGDVSSFMAGRTFELAGHPLPDHDIAYLLDRVVHRARFRRADEGGDHRDGSHYDNEFVCHPLALGHAPPRRPRPVVDGMHSATVVGPKGEEIHTDEYGRIKVRFAWDRFAADDDSAGCWLRCVQTWAGSGFGTMVLPRVGMEVLVAFIDGDADRPVCTGCLYNGWNPPPHPLPEHKTRTVLRTSSSPGGDGYNELFFEDAAGHEMISLHAQRNLMERVRANHATNVGVDQTLEVGRDQKTEILGSRTERVVGMVDTTVEGTVQQWFDKDHVLQVLGNQNVHLDGSQHVYVGGGPSKDGQRAYAAVGTAALKVDGTRRVDASAAIALNCGPFDAAISTVSMIPTMTRLVVGNSSITLLPDRIVIAAENIVLKSKDADLVMAGNIAARAGEEIVLARGETIDSINRISLDGDALLRGAAATVSGDDSVELMAAAGAGKVTIDGSEAITYHSVKARIEEAGGAFLEIAGGMFNANQ